MDVRELTKVKLYLYLRYPEEISPKLPRKVKNMFSSLGNILRLSTYIEGSKTYATRKK